MAHPDGWEQFEGTVFPPAPFSGGVGWRSTFARGFTKKSALILLRIAGTLLLVCCTWVARIIPVATTSPYEWRTNPKRRPPLEIEKIGDLLADEAVRVVTGQLSDTATRRSVWRTAEYGGNSGPPPVPPFAARLLEEAYAGVPKWVLHNVTWQDAYPTFASRDYGLVINRERTSQLVWLVDSLSFVNVSQSLRGLHVREPGDFALLILISHEMAHLAITSAPLIGRNPESVVECAADVIAGFQTAAVAPRISSQGGWELGGNGAVDALGTAIIPGEWVSRDLHPDNEQRSACLHRGIGMFSEQGERGPIAGSLILASERDSLIDALSLGKTTLVDAAFAEAKTILSLPGVPEPKQSSFSGQLDNGSVKTVLLLVDSLLRRFANNTLATVVGQRLAVGVSLFPGTVFNELLLKVAAPWKCAVIAGNPDIGRSIGCYALMRDMDALFTRIGVANALQRDSLSLGFRVLSVGPSTTSTSRLHLRQWLFMNGDKQAVVSVYDEPYNPNPYEDRHSGPTVFWFSFSDLRVIPKGRQR